jgi:hypothetical protein
VPSNVIAPQQSFGGASISAREAERRQQLEAGILQRARRDAQPFDKEIFAQRPFIERELDVESRRESRLDGGERRLVEALFREALVVDRRRTF